MGAARRTRRHDRDLIPDFADGYNFDESPDTADDVIAPLQSGFVPMVVTLPPGVEGSTAKLKFTYTPSDPDGVQTSTATVPHSDEEITLYSPAGGDLRIWKQDAGAQRTIANDYVEPGTWYTASEVTDLYVEGINPGETTVTVELDPTGGSGPLADDTVLFTVVKLDIDVDSDNDATLSQSDREDAIEDRNGNGVGQVGKRVFLNMDDDNKNGIRDADDAKGAYTALGLDDKDFAQVKLGAMGISGSLEGYSLWLAVPTGMSAWGDRQKTTLSDVAQPPDGGVNLPWDQQYDPNNGTWYYWDIGSQGASFPATVFVEGRVPGEAKVFWRLVEPGGSGASDADIVERDTVEVNVEKIVWPSNETGSDWTGNPTAAWDGLELADAWYIDKSLEQIINGDDSFARTLHPEIAAEGGNDPVALNGEGPDSYTTEAYPDGFTLTCKFAYDSGYVQGDTNGSGAYDAGDAHKLSFFANSGIKIWGIYEIQIFDTAKVLALAGVSVDSTDGVVSAPGYSPDEEARYLMTGVPYGGNAGAPYYDGMTDWEDAAGSPNRYLQTLQNNANRFSGGGTLTVTFKPNGTGGYEVKTYAGAGESAVLAYSNSNVTHGTGGASGTALSSIASESRRIRMQSHWDSGVEFTKLTIGAPPE